MQLTIADSRLPERGELLPNQIQTCDRFNVRRYESTEAIEDIERLAETIERDGQLDDIILVPMDDRLVLLAGHRRRRAVALINEKRSAVNKPLMKLRYQIDRTGGDLFRKAVISNLQRKDFSPMDLALLIDQIRKENNWKGFQGAKKVAEYLGVSVTTVTQHEKFLGPGVDSELRTSLHSGEISAQSAYELLNNVPKENVPGVLQRAREIQTDKNIEQAINDTEQHRLTNEQAAERLHGKRRLTSPAIREAIRESPAPHVDQPMSRREILEFILQFDSPAFGGPDGQVRSWVVAFDKMATGAGGKAAEKACRQLFQQMVSRAEKGTIDTGEKPRKVKSATGRKVRKDVNENAVRRRKQKAAKS